MGIKAGSNSDRAMPEDLLNGLERHALGEHQTGSAVSEVVKPDRRQAGLGEQALVGSVEVYGLNRTAGAVAEDQIETTALPVRTGRQSLLELSDAVRA